MMINLMSTFVVLLIITIIAIQIIDEIKVTVSDTTYTLIIK